MTSSHWYTSVDQAPEYGPYSDIIDMNQYASGFVDSRWDSVATNGLGLLYGLITASPLLGYFFKDDELYLVYQYDEALITGYFVLPMCRFNLYDLQEKLESFSPDLLKDESFIEMWRHLNAAGNSAPDIASHFSHLSDALEEIKEVKGQRLLPVYHTISGDQLFCNEQGAYLWYQLETDKYIKAYSETDEMLTHYVKCLMSGDDFGSWAYLDRS